MNNYNSYADVLESYIIAEEGLLDKVKDAGKFIWSKMIELIQALIRKISILINKLRATKRITLDEYLNKHIKKDGERKQIVSQIWKYGMELNHKVAVESSKQAQNAVKLDQILTKYSAKIKSNKDFLDNANDMIQDISQNSDDALDKLVEGMDKYKMTSKTGMIAAARFIKSGDYKIINNSANIFFKLLHNTGRTISNIQKQISSTVNSENVDNSRISRFCNSILSQIQKSINVFYKLTNNILTNGELIILN